MAGGDAQITELHLSDDFLEDVQRVPKPAATPANAAATAATPAAGSATLPPFPPQAAAPAGASGPAGAERAATLEEAELELIRQVLASVNGNISEASKRLGVSRNTIYRKLRRDEPGPG